MTSCSLLASLSSLSTPQSTPSDSLPSSQNLASPVSTVNSFSQLKKPRKNRSAYTLFALDIKPKLKASSDSKISSADLQTTISQLWKDLPANERKQYQEQASEEKLRYMLKLKNFYQNATPETLEEATKAKPKRPYSAYCYFVKEIRQVINIPDTKFKMQEILKQASEKWRQLSEDEKAVYQRKAREAKEAYMTETVEDSETAESIKLEVSDSQSSNMKKIKKESQTDAKTGLNKRKGIHFPKEILDKMEEVEQRTVCKKIKTNISEEIKVQLGNGNELCGSPAEKSLIFEKLQAGTVEIGKLREISQMTFLPQVPTGAFVNMASLAQPWPLNAALMNPNINLMRDMNLMMGYEQMRRQILSQILLNNSSENVFNPFCLTPFGTKVEIKTESH